MTRRMHRQHIPFEHSMEVGCLKYLAESINSLLWSNDALVGHEQGQPVYLYVLVMETVVVGDYFGDYLSLANCQPV